MDSGKSISYAFEDENWLSKLGVGALISLVPILNFAWLGYLVDIMRNVSDGQAEPLPGWDELGEKFTKGLYISIAGLIYSLPGLLFLCLPFGFILIPLFSEYQDLQQALTIGASLASIAMFCCIGFYFLLFSFIFPAVNLNFARQGTFQACFRLREIIGLITTHTGDYLIAWLVAIVAGLAITVLLGIIGLILGWIPCLGQILLWAVGAIAGAYTGAVYAHLFGQIGTVTPAA